MVNQAEVSARDAPRAAGASAAIIQGGVLGARFLPYVAAAMSSQPARQADGFGQIERGNPLVPSVAGAQRMNDHVEESPIEGEWSEVEQLQTAKNGRLEPPSMGSPFLLPETTESSEENNEKQ